MPAAIQYTVGQRFNSLTYLGEAPSRPQRRMGAFLCDCGNTIVTRVARVIKGETKSCGCFKKKAIGIRSTKHGHARWSASGVFDPSPTYVVWRAMIDRCKPSHKDRSTYFDRGITVCERWLHSFECFLADMGERPSGMTLDRAKNEIGYEPGNCQWATRKAQTRNRRSNRLIEHQGQVKTLAEWAEISGINRSTLSTRLHRGITSADELFGPLKK